MIGIDSQDRILTAFLLLENTWKDTEKSSFYIFDMALFNSYILYNKNNMEKK